MMNDDDDDEAHTTGDDHHIRKKKTAAAITYCTTSSYRKTYSMHYGTSTRPLSYSKHRIGTFLEISFIGYLRASQAES